MKSLKSTSPVSDTGADNTWRAALWNGATMPSWRALLIAGVVNLILVTVCVTAITRQAMARHLGPYLTRNSADDDTYVTCGALALGEEDGRRPIVVIIGASSLLMGVFEEDLSQQIRAATGVTTPVYKLATGRQSFWESAALADMVPKNSRGVLILGVEANRLAYDGNGLAKLVAQQRLGFRSEAFDAEARLAGLTSSRATGNYFFDNHGFLLPRMPSMITHFVTGPVPAEHRYLHQAQQTEPEWQRVGDKADAYFSRYDTNRETNLTVVTRLAERLKRDTQMSLVLLRPPVNPRFLREYKREGLYQENSNRVRRFAEEHGAAYWDVQEVSKLTEADFWDWCHLNDPAAIDRHTAALGDRIIAALKHLPDPPGISDPWWERVGS